MEKNDFSYMKNANTIKILINTLDKHFKGKDKYFELFSNNDTRIEGWFKAEILISLNELKDNHYISEFKLEHLIKNKDGKRKSIDFFIKFNNNVSFLIEVKATVISRYTTSRNLNYYFREDHVGILKDFYKLNSILSDANKCVMAFIYPTPEKKDWDVALDNIRNNNKTMNWVCISVLQNYQERKYFMPVWINTSQKDNPILEI